MATKVVPVVDLQLARDLEAEPFQALSQYRNMAPFWAESGDFYQGGFWVVGKFEHCRDVLQDADAFPTEVFGDPPLMPTMVNPPALQDLRRVILPHLAHGRIMKLDSHIRQIAGDYIDAIAARGACDLVADFARLYPIAVFSELFGLERERSQEFRELAEQYLHHYGADRDRAWASIRGLMEAELIDRRDRPRDDLLTGIAQGTIDEKLLDIDLCTNLASTVFLGGLDTLPSNLGWSFRYLATHPAARIRIVREPTIVPAMVEEFLRYYPVVAKERRLVGRDLRFHGADMKAGDRVVCLMSLANRDGDEFEDGETIRFDRKVNRHMSFGAGPHRCLGSNLARHELSVALTEWHRRIPDYRIVNPDSIRFQGGILSLHSLPLEWSATAAEPVQAKEIA